MKKYVALILLFTLLMPLALASESWYCSDCKISVNGKFCSNCGKKGETENKATGEGLTLHVDFEENAVFSKYDVLLYIDGKMMDVLPHGKEYNKTMSVSKGMHTIRFVNAKDDDVYGFAVVQTSKNTSVQCKISAHNDHVSVDEIKLEGADNLLSGKVGKFSTVLKTAFTKSNALHLVMDFSHTSEEAQAFAWNLTVDCFQDGIACDTAFTWDESNTWTEIKKGVTLEVLHCVKMKKLAPIEVEISEIFSFSGSKKLSVVLDVK